MKLVPQGLGDEHPVERVTMLAGQLPKQQIAARSGQNGFPRFTAGGVPREPTRWGRWRKQRIPRQGTDLLLVTCEALLGWGNSSASPGS